MHTRDTQYQNYTQHRTYLWRPNNNQSTSQKAPHSFKNEHFSSTRQPYHYYNPPGQTYYQSADRKRKETTAQEYKKENKRYRENTDDSFYEQQVEQQRIQQFLTNHRELHDKEQLLKQLEQQKKEQSFQQQEILKLKMELRRSEIAQQELKDKLLQQKREQEAEFQKKIQEIEAAQRLKQLALHKQELQDKRKLKTPLVKETIAEKLLSHFELNKTASHAPSSSTNNNSSNSSIPPLPSSTVPLNDYSQAVLLKKINTYLDLAKKDKISEEGYCHGLTLLWLTMMSWGVEKIFYEMIKVIADCPEGQLNSIGSKIAQFLDWIEVGQNPGKYSGEACHQQNIDEIIGDVGALIKETGSFTKQQLAAHISKLKASNNMMNITGWWSTETTDEKTQKKVTKEKGHTVGVFVRGNYNYLFNPNYKNGRPKILLTSEELAEEAWDCVFKKMGVADKDSQKLQVNGVKRESSLKSFYYATPHLFSGKGKGEKAENTVPNQQRLSF